MRCSGPRRAPDQLQEDGDMAGAAVWHRIIDCIERLQATKPAEGEKVQ
jgi:hypothetical protein